MVKGLGGQNENVVALYDDHLVHFSDDEENEVSRICIQYKDIRSLDFGRVLLKTWIVVRGTDLRGSFSLKFEYNTAVDTLFRPIIERFRYLHAGVVMPKLSSHAQPVLNADLDDLLKTDFKIFSYANMNVSPGTHIRGVLYEAAVRQTLSSIIHMVRIPSQALVLTDRELIRVSEEKPAASLFRVRASYGAITSFVPLEHIQAIGVHPGSEPDTVQLRLTLDPGRVSWTFAAHEAAALRAFAGRILAEPIAA